MTKLTFEGLFSSVVSHINFKMTACFERVWAMVPFEGLFSTVVSHMNFQITACESKWAVITFAALFRCGFTYVLLKYKFVRM